MCFVSLKLRGWGIDVPWQELQKLVE